MLPPELRGHMQRREFIQRLRELGHIEGQNLVTDYLNPERQAEGIPGAIKELIRRKVDIIVAPYESTVKSAIAASDTTPVVMIATEYDPLARGYVKTRHSGQRSVLTLDGYAAIDPYRSSTLPYIVASARDDRDARKEAINQSGRTP
jgi:hypothetical protein